MKEELCFGQKIDDSLGILFPWYTHGVLDVISKWDLSDKIIMEWGMGASTLWWAKKAKLVVGVDHNLEWYYKVNGDLSANGLSEKTNIGCVQTYEGDTSEGRDTYVKHFEVNNKMIKDAFPEFQQVQNIDIAIVDGIHRYECAEYAVKVLKPEILIVDNHQQDYVFICPKLDELLEGVKMERFIQPDHTNHEGRPWATAIFYLNEKA
jgi:hypothetical protein